MSKKETKEMKEILIQTAMLCKELYDFLSEIEIRYQKKIKGFNK